MTQNVVEGLVLVRVNSLRVSPAIYGIQNVEGDGTRWVESPIHRHVWVQLVRSDSTFSSVTFRACPTSFLLITVT